MTKASPALVEGCLKNFDFPAGKETLVNYAKERCAGQSEVISTLESLPEKEYRTAVEVTKSMKEID